MDVRDYLRSLTPDLIAAMSKDEQMRLAKALMKKMDRAELLAFLQIVESQFQKDRAAL